ncbi:MAG: Uma2 family endonuclease [Bryobacterales bacterium]|nr:Uma2 family endonuclease [Bryobacterales bacterium]
MATQPLPRISPEEYVALEQKLGVKHEYHAGQMFAMAGVSLPHGRIQMNLAYRVTGALMDAPCSAYPSDVRVVIEAADMATYPDLSIVCGPDQPAKSFRHSITNPTVLIEVLSPSTERYDRGAKFEQYRKLESLREYVLISQDAMAVDLFRLENGKWVFHPLRGEATVLSLVSAGIEIPLRDIYRGVNFEDAE